jgi:pyruvate formate lyase activating enzyme
MSKLTAIITNFQRFSLDDGDGIRTTIFFKGCPLRCLWCHNPECLYAAPELQFIQTRCIQCNRCLNVCLKKVFSTDASGLRILDRKKCTHCGECVMVCGQTALKITGRAYTIDDVMNEVLKDRNFYTNSGGGVTLSGGEPFGQYPFTLELLRTLKKANISTAVDTCGCVPAQRFRETADYTDMYLLDIKTFSPSLHKKLTGMDNRMVMNSLDIMTSLKSKIYIRIPLIAGINDSLDEIGEIAKLLAGNSCIQLVELLAYHALGASKYATLGRVYQGSLFRTPNTEYLEVLANCFITHGIPVRIKTH